MGERRQHRDLRDVPQAHHRIPNRPEWMRHLLCPVMWLTLFRARGYALRNLCALFSCFAQSDGNSLLAALDPASRPPALERPFFPAVHCGLHTFRSRSSVLRHKPPVGRLRCSFALATDGPAMDASNVNPDGSTFALEQRSESRHDMPDSSGRDWRLFPVFE
jgi:hypothetical protein